jgi:hypothetical protein
MHFFSKKIFWRSIKKSFKYQLASYLRLIERSLFRIIAYITATQWIKRWCLLLIVRKTAHFFCY